MLGRLRRRVIVVPLLIILVASVSGGVVAAQALIDDGDAHDRILERAEEILGLEPGALSGAVEQARTELADEKVDALLAELVENGHLTQDEADEIRAWLNARPGAIKPITAATLRGLIEGVTPFAPFDGGRIERFHINPPVLPRIPEFHFGDSFDFELPDLSGLTPEELREQLEERFREFGGSGSFEFRFGDHPPFQFEFPAPDDSGDNGDGDSDADAQDTSI